MSASAWEWARGRKPDRSSAGRKGSTDVGGEEEMQMRRGRKGKGKEAGGEGRNIPSDDGGERGGAGSAGEGRE